MCNRLIIALFAEHQRSSRLSIDTFATIRSPGGGNSRSPRSPASHRSLRRRDSNDYEKSGQAETKVDMTDRNQSMQTLVSSAQHKKPSSVRSRATSISQDRLPTFDGPIVKQEPFEEIGLDNRSVRSEGTRRDSKAGSGRDGTASA